MHVERGPIVKPTPKPFAGFPSGSLMLLPTPDQVRSYVERIPCGECRTVKQMREELASEHGAHFTCPVVTGIYLRIVGEAALEVCPAGCDPAIPFWRVVDPRSPLAKRLSCGPRYIWEKRRAEA
jgi:hypothetical protein